MNSQFEALDPETQQKLLSILENFRSPCRCEAYYNYTCNRCRRLAKQGGGDTLLGKVATERTLRQLGLL